MTGSKADKANQCNEWTVVHTHNGVNEKPSGVHSTFKKIGD